MPSGKPPIPKKPAEKRAAAGSVRKTTQGRRLAETGHGSETVDEDRYILEREPDGRYRIVGRRSRRQE